ncbi:MAG TPA: potassium channel family protein [Candidatus Dormibacteraeota bacterium]|nr:potassium channel family protein [Candidatus Dormibacteraeota bacterium]
MRSWWGWDRYGVLLLLIIASIICFGLLGDLRWGRPASLGLVAIVVLMALKASAVPSRWLQVTALVLAVLLILTVITVLGEGDRPSRLINQSILVVLLAIAPTAVALRVAQHRFVNLSTVAGTVCVYLLVGFLFASLYELVALAGSAPFFASQASADSVDYLYFSYATLTTVGYGDLTARGDLGRMLSVTEALMGQVYLVTVVALVVANIGRERRQRRP